MDNIEVSVIIPVYNGAKYIGKAIDSALNQNVSLEIIIIDDCSNDNLIEVIEPYINSKNIKYIRNKVNLGVGKSRNLGIKLARGEYIGFLDADDWWACNKLEEQIPILKCKSYSLCYTGRALFTSDGESLNTYLKVKQIIYYEHILFHNWIPCSSVLISRNVMVDFLNQSESIHEDYFAWLYILKKNGKAYGIDKPLLNYRLNKKSKTANKIKSTIMTYKTLRKFNITCFKSIIYTLSHLIIAIYCRLNRKRKLIK